MKKLEYYQQEKMKILLLDVYQIMIISRLIAVDLSRQKKSDADPKAIQQIEYLA